jgi:PKD repeat protein
MNGKSLKQYTWLVAGFIGMIAMLITVVPGCKKVPLYALDGTITLSANKTALRTGGDKATITIIGFGADGKPMHDNTVVLLTTTLGTLPSSVDLEDGRATAELISTNTNGTAVITAQSGKVISTNPLSIVIGSAAVNFLTIAANPPSFNNVGGRSQIKVGVYDASGNPVPNVLVSLTANSGRFDQGGGMYTTDSQGRISDWLAVTQTTHVTAECNSKKTEMDVTVTTGKLPTAEFSYSPSAPSKADNVFFNGSLSHSDNGPIATYTWDFGDGMSAQGVQVAHYFNDAKSYDVMLTVTDSTGAVGMTHKTVTITINPNPIAIFSFSPQSPVKNTPVYFTGGQSTATNATIVSYAWNFGDGSAVASGDSVTHTFANAMTYSVTLKVTDSKGGTGQSSQSITVTAYKPPTANFSFSPAAPLTTDYVYFNGTISTAGDGAIVSYSWDFGDGSGVATGPAPSHQFTTANTYQVTLTVTDSNGLSSVAQKSIVVN